MLLKTHLKVEGLLISKIGFDLINHEGNLNIGYEDIVDISRKCKFSNCSHTNEPQCAVKKPCLMEFFLKKYLKIIIDI